MAPTDQRRGRVREIESIATRIERRQQQIKKMETIHHGAFEHDIFVFGERYPWIVCSNTLNNHLLLSFNTWEIVLIYCFIKYHTKPEKSFFIHSDSRIWTVFCYFSEMCQVTVWLAAAAAAAAILLLQRRSRLVPCCVPIWSRIWNKFSAKTYYYHCECMHEMKRTWLVPLIQHKFILGSILKTACLLFNFANVILCNVYAAHVCRTMKYIFIFFFIYMPRPPIWQIELPRFRHLSFAIVLYEFTWL